MEAGGAARVALARARILGCSTARSRSLLTEQEVSRSWSRLFKGVEIDSEVLSRAEALLEELRAESPLRHRLTCELQELRQLKTKTKKKRQPVGEGV